MFLQCARARAHDGGQRAEYLNLECAEGICALCGASLGMKGVSTEGCAAKDKAVGRKKERSSKFLGGRGIHTDMKKFGGGVWNEEGVSHVSFPGTLEDRQR